MFSPENEVIILSAATAVILLFSISSFTELPTWVSIAIVVIVGVLVPQFIMRTER
jgi:hypothetical protein